MAKLRMAHASTHGARKPPGPIDLLHPLKFNVKTIILSHCYGYYKVISRTVALFLPNQDVLQDSGHGDGLSCAGGGAGRGAQVVGV